jgi:hypothetical protein
MPRLLAAALLALAARAGAQTVLLPAATASWEVNLVWQAPAVSPDPVAGYEAFRSPTGLWAYQLLAGTVAAPVTAYTDATVEPGQTYDYIVESEDASGNLSVPSNVATVAVPAGVSAPANLNFGGTS